MNMNEYQQLAQRTGNDKLDGKLRLTIAGLGLTGEAGEVADIIKKAIGHGHQLDIKHIEKELGDVLWYVAEVAAMVGLDLDEIAEANINKLKKRYPEGFSEAQSINRSKGDV